MWQELINACGQTLAMVALSSVVAALSGGLWGMVLFSLKTSQLCPNPKIYFFLGSITNATRSVPFIILMIAIIPLTRWLTGSSIGTVAACVPLSLSAMPFVARIVESALVELPRGLLETAVAMGATRKQILFNILLPEALPAIASGLTLTVVTLVGYSAMAGTMGGGGLGDLAINYGYQRFDAKVMLMTVVVLIVMVQLIQMLGEKITAFLRRGER